MITLDIGDFFLSECDNPYDEDQFSNEFFDLDDPGPILNDTSQTNFRPQLQHQSSQQAIPQHQGLPKEPADFQKSEIEKKPNFQPKEVLQPLPKNNFQISPSHSWNQALIDNSAAIGHGGSVRCQNGLLPEVNTIYSFRSYLNRRVYNNPHTQMTKQVLHFLYELFIPVLNIPPLTRNEKRNKDLVYRKLFFFKQSIVFLLENYEKTFLLPIILYGKK
ncbi:hypothetical protein TRFO_08787 [Tritrichomonas foetus]|uniref:Uncharacterized protein n=1 Tax=Tritrichomonas foetus TaxID=1144522 RepID=A0A1J4JHB7_9EUKA|nr:hypothetical protein TRFO_08787 [Tritrichomonas foetus]|eukprot:OHS98526.1 hypothetical protein TRFO_08787 [Tritrichomonas foetus]